MIKKVNQIARNGSWSGGRPQSKHLFEIHTTESFRLEWEFDSVSFFTVGKLGWSNMWKLSGGITHGTNYKMARSKVFNISNSRYDFFQ